MLFANSRNKNWLESSFPNSRTSIDVGVNASTISLSSIHEQLHVENENVSHLLSHASLREKCETRFRLGMLA